MTDHPDQVRPLVCDQRHIKGAKLTYWCISFLKERELSLWSWSVAECSFVNLPQHPLCWDRPKGTEMKRRSSLPPPPPFLSPLGSSMIIAALPNHPHQLPSQAAPSFWCLWRYQPPSTEAVVPGLPPPAPLYSHNLLYPGGSKQLTFSCQSPASPLYLISSYGFIKTSASNVNEGFVEGITEITAALFGCLPTKQRVCSIIHTPSTYFIFSWSGFRRRQASKQKVCSLCCCRDSCLVNSIIY